MYDDINLALRSDTEEFQKTQMVDELRKGIGNNVSRLVELCERSGVEPQRAYIVCFTAAGNDTDVILLHKILTQILEEQRPTIEASLRDFSKQDPTELFELSKKTGLTPAQVVELIKSEGNNIYDISMLYNSMLSRLDEKSKAIKAANQTFGFQEEKTKAM